MSAIAMIYQQLVRSPSHLQSEPEAADVCLHPHPRVV